jgi:uncharacterized membrane protein YebE (DUF533 family)
MFDPQQLLNQLLGAGGSGGGAGDAGALGDVLGQLGLGGRSGAGGLGDVLGRLGLGGRGGAGGAAALAGLAYKAWQDWQAGRPASAAAMPAQAGPPALPPAGNAFDLSAHKAGDGHDPHLAIVRAMIAAAKADGRIDADEQKAVFDRIGKLGLDPEAKAFLKAEIAKPLDPGEIAALAASPEQGAQIWLASRLTIRPDDPRERAYLKQLAARLSLAPDLLAHLERQATAA